MKRYMFLGIVFLLVVGLSVGCAANERVDPNTRNQNQNDGLYNDPNNVNPNNTNPGLTNPNNPNNMNPGNADPDNFVNPAVPRDNRTPGDLSTTPRDNNTGDGVQNNNRTNNDVNRGNDIVDIVEDIDGVNNATAVVAGETAYVGIDIDKNISDSDTNRLKEEVGKRVREEENVTRVYVSADMDTFERLRGIGREIGQGRPISGFLNELTEMFRRPVPAAQ